MAVTAVPSSQVAQATAAHGTVSSANASRAPARSAPPSAIAHISPEGKLRAEQDRQQVATAALDEALKKQNAVSQANAVPHRNPVEQATDVAAIAAVAVPVPSADLPLRQSSNTQPAEPVVKSIVATQRREQQAENDAAPSIGQARPQATEAAVQAAPVKAANEIAAPLPVREPVAPQQTNREETLSAPATSPSRAANESTVSAAVENSAATNSLNSFTVQNHVNQVRITQAANEFVAAFNQQQGRRDHAQVSAAPGRQAPVVPALEPRNAAPSNVRNDSAVDENLARRVEVDPARANPSTFAVGVARNSAAQAQRQSAGVAVTRDESSELVQNSRTPVAHSEQNRAPAAVISRVSAPAESISQIKAHSIAASEHAQNEQQNNATSSHSNQAGGASVEQGAGLAKHLNALANLLTP